MEKQLLPALAVLVFCALYTAAIAAQSRAQAAPASPERTRAEVHRLGFGKRVKVKLHNGTKVRGRITGVSDDQFVVTGSEDGAVVQVAFSDVVRIRKQREMPLVLKSVLVGVAFTAAVVGTLVVIGLSVLD
jgi:biotin-(acetyl-CoA carboxylase) ligase